MPFLLRFTVSHEEPFYILAQDIDSSPMLREHEDRCVMVYGALSALSTPRVITVGKRAGGGFKSRCARRFMVARRIMVRDETVNLVQGGFESP